MNYDIQKKEYYNYNMKMLHYLTGFLSTSNDNIWKNTNPFVPPIEGGICINVPNTNTLFVAARLPYPESPCYRFKIKLDRIICPNMDSKSEEEKSIAQLTKQTLEELVKMKHVQLKNVKMETRGNLLADVYCEDIFVNQYLLDQRLATIEKPKSWLKYYSQSYSSSEDDVVISESESSSKS